MKISWAYYPILTLTVFVCLFPNPVLATTPYDSASQMYQSGHVLHQENIAVEMISRSGKMRCSMALLRDQTKENTSFSFTVSSDPILGRRIFSQLNANTSNEITFGQQTTDGYNTWRVFDVKDVGSFLVARRQRAYITLYEFEILRSRGITNAPLPTTDYCWSIDTVGVLNDHKLQ